MKIKTGNVQEAKTLKAGCGIRYDPDQLNEDSGFDFSKAAELKVEELASNRDEKAGTADERKDQG